MAASADLEEVTSYSGRHNVIITIIAITFAPGFDCLGVGGGWRWVGGRAVQRFATFNLHKSKQEP